MAFDRDYCFGRNSSATWGIIIGVLIILAGATQLLEDTIPWMNWDTLWPVFVIIIGLLIVGNALKRR